LQHPVNTLFGLAVNPHDGLDTVLVQSASQFEVELLDQVPILDDIAEGLGDEFCTFTLGHDVSFVAMNIL